MKCDVVFEGGGVKGIGFAGAISALESHGYRFENVAGSSAGAIAASLVAVGYTGKEIERELMAADFNEFRGTGLLSRFGPAGKLLSLTVNYGIYKSGRFERWLDGLLRKKGKYRFGDIRTGFKDEKYKYRFQAIASDLSDRRMLVLPRDLALFGIDPDDFEISKAVRMSMSIPFYYQPFKLRDVGGGEHFIADGGLLSNYPIWLLDDGTDCPPWPTFGMKFTCDGKQAGRRRIDSFADYTKAVVSTMLEAGDNYHISESNGDFQRSIMIPVVVRSDGALKTIGTTDFDITKEESAALAENGRRAAERFLKRWDFGAWKAKYRQGGSV